MLSGCKFTDWVGNIFHPNKNQEEKNKDDNGIKNLKNPYTATVNYYGSYLYDGWTSQGVKMDCTMLSCDVQNERLRNLTSEQVNNKSNLLSELFFTNLNTGYYDYVNSADLALTIGTGDASRDEFNSGTFIWTSVKKIYKVEITAKCYEKGEYTLDSNAHLKIEAGIKGTDVKYTRPISNKQTKDLSFAAESGVSVYKSYSTTYAEGVDRFCLTSLDGRVVIKSLTITWDLE